MHAERKDARNQNLPSISEKSILKKVKTKKANNGKRLTIPPSAQMKRYQFKLLTFPSEEVLPNPLPKNGFAVILSTPSVHASSRPPFTNVIFLYKLDCRSKSNTFGAGLIVIKSKARDVPIVTVTTSFRALLFCIMTEQMKEIIPAIRIETIPAAENVVKAPRKITNKPAHLNRRRFTLRKICQTARVPRVVKYCARMVGSDARA